MALSWNSGTWYSIWEYAPNGTTKPWQRTGPGTSYSTI
mgnify:CR=1 FL=1